jgi:hypothetical protein
LKPFDEELSVLRYQNIRSTKVSSKFSQAYFDALEAMYDREDDSDEFTSDTQTNIVDNSNEIIPYADHSDHGGDRKGANKRCRSCNHGKKKRTRLASS